MIVVVIVCLLSTNSDYHSSLSQGEITATLYDGKLIRCAVLCALEVIKPQQELIATKVSTVA